MGNKCLGPTKGKNDKILEVSQDDLKRNKKSKGIAVTATQNAPTATQTTAGEMNNISSDGLEAQPIKV